jgi:hypothetical protein
MTTNASSSPDVGCFLMLTLYSHKYLFKLCNCFLINYMLQNFQVLAASVIRAHYSIYKEASKHLWNVGKLLPDYTALQPRRQPSYPDDVGISLVGKIKHFHAYNKQNYSNKGHLCHQNPHQVVFQDMIQLAFPNVEIILWLFLSLW